MWTKSLGECRRCEKSLSNIPVIIRFERIHPVGLFVCDFRGQGRVTNDEAFAVATLIVVVYEFAQTFKRPFAYRLLSGADASRDADDQRGQ